MVEVCAPGVAIVSFGDVGYHRNSASPGLRRQTISFRDEKGLCQSVPVQHDLDPDLPHL
jgi:hypothetical protein